MKSLLRLNKFVYFSGFFFVERMEIRVATSVSESRARTLITIMEALAKWSYLERTICNVTHMNMEWAYKIYTIVVCCVREYGWIFYIWMVQTIQKRNVRYNSFVPSLSVCVCVCGAMRCVCIFQCFPCLMVGGYTYYPYVANEIHRFHRSFIQTY